MLLSFLSSFGVWGDYRERSQTLTDWAALNLTFMNLFLEDRTVSVLAGSATPSFFRVLGAQPLLGRLFRDEEGVEGGPNLVVLDWFYWQNAMGGEEDVVGRTLTLNGSSHEVIGVLHRGFEFMTPQVDLWINLRANPVGYPRNMKWTMSLARMVPGVTMAQVEAEVTRIAREIETEDPEGFRGWTMDPINLRTEFPDPWTRVYLGLMAGSVVFVLLIVCANISNLLLARNQERRWEIALRTALGAGRFRIFRDLLMESMVMAVVGGAIGLAVATLAMRFTSEVMDRWMPRMWHPSLDTGIVLFTIGASVACGLIFGLLPILQSLRTNQVEALKQGGGGRSGGSRRSGIVRAGLVVAQISLSLVALGAGAMLSEAFLDLTKREPGFDTSGILTALFEVPGRDYPTVGDAVRLQEDLRDRAEALPGVTAAALIRPLPRDLFLQMESFFLGQDTSQAITEAPEAVALFASPEYLKTTGIPLLQGRFFQESDRRGAPHVAVVNRELAQRYFPGRDPIGQLITARDVQLEIVGVVGDVRQSLFPRPGGRPAPAIYFSLAQASQRSSYLIIRTRGDPHQWADPVRRMVWDVNPRIPVITVETIEEFATRYGGMGEVYNVILAAFGVLALLLASLGTYGVVSYSVAQRTPEIGVRMAMGARPWEVVTLVARQGITMAFLGIGIGGALVIPVLSGIERVFVGFGVPRVDHLVIVGVAALLFTVTVVATVIPASRAASVNPMEVLKAE
jgi:predicted permease